MSTTAQKKRVNRAFKRERRRIREIKGVWPLEDPQYLDFIRSLPCVACYADLGQLYIEVLRSGWGLPDGGRHRNPNGQYTEPDHVGRRGKGQKCSDHETVPLCRSHHDERHAHPLTFWNTHSLDLAELLAALQAAYEQRGDRC